MKRRVEINGDLVRKEREKRAWTQEELSERSKLGVRTVRRLEAGEASMATIRRVAEALVQDIAAPGLEEPPRKPSAVQQLLLLDPLEVEVGVGLVELLEDGLVERIASIRRHIALELGLIIPGVRFRDNLDNAPNMYRLKLWGLEIGCGTVHPGRSLAVGNAEQLQALDGERTLDPTYGMTGIWTSNGAAAEAAGCIVFCPVSVIATHLTFVIRRNAAQLLGLDEVQHLLDNLCLPVLVREVGARLSLPHIRTVLGNLLAEDVSIRNLRLILETLVDHADAQRAPRDLTEIVRLRLAPVLCKANANKDGEIAALVSDRVDAEFLEQELQHLQQRGLQRIVVTSPALRRRVWELLGPPTVVLSEAEIAPGFQVIPLRVSCRGAAQDTG